MSISPVSEPSPSITRSEFLSSLPRWRRWLAMLNWHPVVDLEIREIERERRLQQLRKETEQLRNESEQIEKETEQLKKENARLAELNARIAALWPSSNTSSTQAPPPSNDSPT
ncbi:MAG: hypothetical protein VKI83_02390 [Synechococcaceae cyanobacterium]|nr:hypothetical protein [Synechococcaceae cyanobacterium]